MSELLGAQVRRVDAPWPDLLAVTLAGRELRGVLLIGLSPAARGVGFCDARPPGDGRGARGAFVQRAKSCLEGGRVVAAVRREPAGLLLVVERGGEQVSLEAWLRGSRGNALLRDGSGALLTSMHPYTDDRSAQDADAELAPLEELAALRATGEKLLAARATAAIAERRLELVRGLRAGEKRLQRRLAAIERDRDRAAQVETLRRHAGVLLTHLHALGRDASGKIELLDPSVDPPERIAIDVDPLLGPRRQADAWFQSARRLERGAAIAAERARATHAEIARMQALAERVAATELDAELDAIASEARALGVAVAATRAEGATTRARADKQVRLPYRHFVGSGGRAILVGRGAEDNDQLTLKHARPHDLWLHARDDAGSHVVVPLERNESCPPELLADAAMLAAHFSKARGVARVDIIYVERRHVRKARKAPAGQVSVAREKVFRLVLQPERLRALLAAERKIAD